MSNIDATEPRLLPELCVADNIMAVSNFLQKEKDKQEVKQEVQQVKQEVQQVKQEVPNKVN